MAKKNTGKILGIIALAVGGYYLLNKNKAAANTNTSNTNYPTGSLTPVDQQIIPVYTTPADLGAYPIIYNKYSSEAKEIQAALNVNQDGIIGQNTLRALQPYWPATQAFRIDNRSQLNYVLGLIKNYGQIDPINTSGTIDTTATGYAAGSGGNIDYSELDSLAGLETQPY